MQLSGPSGFLGKSRIMYALLWGVAACVLAAVVLGGVARRSGPARGEVVVHVVEHDVEVAVGDRTYRIGDVTYGPIVCELPFGRHELVMRRRGRVLYREPFVLARGTNLVLTAWDPNRHAGVPAQRRTKEGCAPARVPGDAPAGGVGTIRGRIPQAPY